MPKKASIMPKTATKVFRNGVLCYIAVSIIVWVADFGSSGRGQDMIWNIDSMILDPRYDAEHDTQLYSARNGFRKGFHYAQNGPQSGQKWLFVLYCRED